MSKAEYRYDHIRQALSMFEQLVQGNKNTSHTASRWEYLSSCEQTIKMAFEALHSIVDSKNTMCDRCKADERDNADEPTSCTCHTMRMPPCSFCTSDTFGETKEEGK